MKIRYKLPLTDSDKETIERTVALVKKEIESDKAKDQNQAEIAALREKLEGEVDVLKSRFSRSHKADVLEELTFKKSQLAALSFQIDEEGRDAKGRRVVPRDNYYGLMIQMNEIAAPFLNVCAQELREEVAAVIRPFYQLDAYAREAASQTWLVQSFYNWKGNFIAIGAPKSSVIRLMEILESLLKGQEVWTFDPKIKDRAKS